MSKGRLKWSWILCIAQGILAIVLSYYEPYQFRNSIQETKRSSGSERIELGLDFYQRHWPPPCGIALRAINFPPLVLSDAFDLLPHTPLFSNDLRQIYTRDIAFIIWVFIFWYVVGTIADNREWRTETRAQRPILHVVVYATGLVIGLVGGYLAVTQLIHGNGATPENQLSAFGLAWSILLVGYITSRSWMFLRPHTVQS